MQTIKATQFSDEDFFSTTINQDMMEILSSIRDAHMHDSTAADTTGADVVKNALDQANHFEGSAEEAQVAMFLKQLGIKYSKPILNILNRSRSPVSLLYTGSANLVVNLYQPNFASTLCFPLKFSCHRLFVAH